MPLVRIQRIVSPGAGYDGVGDESRPLLRSFVRNRTGAGDRRGEGKCGQAAPRPAHAMMMHTMSLRLSAAHGKTGWPSIPPERLIKAMLLMALYSIRSERQLCEQIGCNLLFRWFLDLKPSESVWTPAVFGTNRQRFADHGLVRARLVGRWKIELTGYAAAAAYDLLRLARLRPLSPPATG